MLLTPLGLLVDWFGTTFGPIFDWFWTAFGPRLDRFWTAFGLLLGLWDCGIVGCGSLSFEF